MKITKVKAADLKDEFDQRLAKDKDIVAIVELAEKELGKNAVSVKNVAQMVGIGNVVIAVRNGFLGEEVIGFLISSKITDEVVALNTLVIKKKYRHRGFGGVMLKSLIISTEKFGYKKLQSIVSTDYNESINRLLNRNGFTVGKRIDDIYNKAGEESSSAVLYVKQLSPKKK